jgi:high-affinity iron transporter
VAEQRIDPDSATRGRSLFLEHCALCHGPRGDGQGLRRGSLSRPPANFRSPLFDPELERVRRAIRDGVGGSDMPGWQRLGDRAVEDLTSHVLELARSVP